MTNKLTQIINELKTNFHCHTVVLYGSRARGDWSDSSDFDILGVSDDIAKVTRHAYKLEDSFVDGFVYPTSALKEIDASHLYMRDGKVLFERDSFGTELLNKIAAVYSTGPVVPEDELNMKKVWAEKMLERVRRGDAEGEYRRHWLIYALLEDYFTFRGLWYEGPKKAFSYLSQNDMEVYNQFLTVFNSPKSIDELEKLAKLIVC